MLEQHKLLASGRASTVRALDERRVLRVGGAPEREARIMEHARAAGFPVPEVHDVREDALVLERIAGPTMLADLRRRPWRLREHARLLAGLHERLHEIPWEGATLLHLDLHPDNVLLSPAGPVVIDWTNAAAGEPALDVALTWVICRTSGRASGRAFARAFRGASDAQAVERALPQAVAFRAADRNVTGAERAAVHALLR